MPRNQPAVVDGGRTWLTSLAGRWRGGFAPRLKHENHPQWVFRIAFPTLVRLPESSHLGRFEKRFLAETPLGQQ